MPQAHFWKAFRRRNQVSVSNHYQGSRGILTLDLDADLAILDRRGAPRLI
jgi:hypothetical protein